MKKAIYKLGIIITLLLTVVVCNNVNASNYYWVGGSGNWTDFSNHWATTSGGGTFQLSPPSSSDNVFFDANSFTSTGQTVTIDFDANCNNMDWTGATNSPTLDGPSYINLYIYGSLTLPTGGMTITFTGTLNFESSSSGNTITSNGKTWQSTVTFGGSGVWTIQDAFATTQAVNFQNGTLTVNNQDFSCYNFETNGGTSGTLNIVSSTFHIENEWNFDPFASVSFNATSSNIIFTGSAWTLWGAGHTFYNITATNTTGSGRLNDNNTFHDLTFAGLVNFNGTETCNDVTVANTGTGNLGSNSTFHNVTLNGDGSFGDGNSMNNLVLNAGHTYIFSGGGTQTITGTLTANGSCSSLITMYSGSPGNQGIISVASGTVALSYVSLQDIYTTGGATFSATNALDLGDNGGLTITTLSSRNLYWVGNSGSWSDASHWSLTSGGSPVGCPPLI